MDICKYMRIAYFRHMPCVICAMPVTLLTWRGVACCSAGEIIMREGRYGRKFVYIVAGNVQVLKGQLAPGEFLHDLEEASLDATPPPHLPHPPPTLSPLSPPYDP